MMARFLPRSLRWRRRDLFVARRDRVWKIDDQDSAGCQRSVIQVRRDRPLHGDIRRGDGNILEKVDRARNALNQVKESTF